MLLAPSCFYPSLPERQHSKAIANAGCVDEDASVQRLVETGRENADVTRAEQASSDGGVGAGWEAGDAPRVWSSGGTEITGTRRCPRGGKELFRVLRLLDHIYLPALKKMCYYYYCFLAMQHGLWDLRDRSCVPCSGLPDKSPCGFFI